MYSDAFCKVYNEFGWNYFPEAFARQLLQWIEENQLPVRDCLDLACGTGVLCRVLKDAGLNPRGMDFSQGMIRIAREENPDIPFEVADMITYRPEQQFDLVTCTGDALNHIHSLQDVGKIFANVSAYLKEGGWFVFDLLNEREISTDEPFDLDFSNAVKAQFQMLREGNGVCLRTTVYENGVETVREEIRERVHDVDAVCTLLEQVGLRVIRRGHSLPVSNPREVATWFILARKTGQ
ncbi:MAG: class I SAM-dependent methyltransferase [Oscillospiraceae bacterium]|nr:class I SAM-dependent methyltransferase [Oscillospiraceae bacterium]